MTIDGWGLKKENSHKQFDRMHSEMWPKLLSTVRNQIIPKTQHIMLTYDGYKMTSGYVLARRIWDIIGHER